MCPGGGGGGGVMRRRCIPRDAAVPGDVMHKTYGVDIFLKLNSDD